MVENNFLERKRSKFDFKVTEGQWPHSAQLTVAALVGAAASAEVKHTEAGRIKAVGHTVVVGTFAVASVGAACTAIEAVA